MFETQTKDEIQKRMAADLSAMNPNSTIEGSFGRDVINATSVEFEKTYAELSLVNQAGFAQTSWGEYLETSPKNTGFSAGVLSEQSAPSRCLAQEPSPRVHCSKRRMVRSFPPPALSR